LQGLCCTANPSVPLSCPEECHNQDNYKEEKKNEEQYSAVYAAGAETVVNLSIAAIIAAIRKNTAHFNEAI
jgi:hypothetical protein